MELMELSSNWKRLQASLKAKSSNTSIPKLPPRGVKRKRGGNRADFHTQKPPMAAIPSSRRPSTATDGPAPIASNGTLGALPTFTKVERVNEGLSSTTSAGKYIAIDCEMVGVGPNPDQDSALARVSVVNYDGDQLYDSYVRPKEQVTDWRTQWSGITSKHMLTARPFEDVQKEIAKVLHGKILIGHAISNDLTALFLTHPKRDIRDTSKHAPFRRISAGSSPRLKLLASELLGIEIQSGAHSSIEDARACMLLFRQDKDAFEKDHAKKWPTRPSQQGSSEGADNAKKKPKKKKKKKKRKH